MSVELSEAKILADQMNEELRGKRIKSYSARATDHRPSKPGYNLKQPKKTRSQTCGRGGQTIQKEISA